MNKTFFSDFKILKDFFISKYLEDDLNKVKKPTISSLIVGNVIKIPEDKIETFISWGSLDAFFFHL